MNGINKSMRGVYFSAGRQQAASGKNGVFSCRDWDMCSGKSTGSIRGFLQYSQQLLQQLIAFVSSRVGDGDGDGDADAAIISLF